MSSIPLNLQAVRQRIESAIRAAGRPAQSVRLVAVSKTFPTEAAREAAQAGLGGFADEEAQGGGGKKRRAAPRRRPQLFYWPIQSEQAAANAQPLPSGPPHSTAENPR